MSANVLFISLTMAIKIGHGSMGGSKSKRKNIKRKNIKRRNVGHSNALIVTTVLASTLLASTVSLGGASATELSTPELAPDLLTPDLLTQRLEQSASVSAPQASTVSSALTELAPTEPASVSLTAIESAPVEIAPIEPVPVKLAPVQIAPVETAPIEISPVQIAQSEPNNDPPKFGKAGTQRWYLQAGAAADFDDDTFLLAGAGISHFFYDGHSVNLELNGLSFSQPGADAAGATLTFLVRSHWIRGENWSLYVDGGAGIIFTTDDVPEDGSSFNFTPQVGGGASFATGGNQRLMTGLRWYHISNADTFENNPGLDALFGYIGINFPL